MAITVEHGPDVTTFKEATKWVIDDHERLHIIGPDGAGNLASYNRANWANVYINTTD